MSRHLALPAAPGAPAAPPATPAAAPKNPNPPPESEKKQRMTVGKLAQKYQERIAEITDNIGKMESIVSAYQQKIMEEKCSLAVWQQALKEIED